MPVPLPEFVPASVAISLVSASAWFFWPMLGLVLMLLLPKSRWGCAILSERTQLLTLVKHWSPTRLIPFPTLLSKAKRIVSPKADKPTHTVLLAELGGVFLSVALISWSMGSLPRMLAYLVSIAQQVVEIEAEIETTKQWDDPPRLSQIEALPPVELVLVLVALVY